MDEALLVDVLAVHAIGRELASRDASPMEWSRYREWRDVVIAAAGVHVAVPVAV